MKKSGIMKYLLCVALLLAIVICPLITKAEQAVGAEDITSSETFATAEYDVAEYRSSTPYTYPRKEGYIFAGWYTDEACTEDTVFTGTSGQAYAKFVKDDILGVKCQIRKDTKSTDETTNLRIVTSVGSDMYAKVGFKIEFEGGTPFYTSIDTVYKTMDGWVNGSNKSYAPYKLFSIASKYLAGCTVIDFPNEDFDKNITITARWKTLDGTTVEGSMKCFSINDVIAAFDYDTEDTASRTQKVAKVGDQYVTTFEGAVSIANDSEEDITIQLLSNVTASSQVTINNTAGKNITIDGCGYTLEGVSTKHAMLVDQTNGTVTIQNCKFEHSGNYMLLRIGANGSTATTDALTVNLTNVDITSASTYKYCLIGIQGPQTFNVNMTDVIVDWNGVSADSSVATRACVRCSASVMGQKLYLTMNDSVIDVVAATDKTTLGVYIAKQASSGEVNLYNTDIYTLVANTYTNAATAVTINADEYCTFTVEDDLQAKIGDTSYSTFAKAVEAANISEEDVTIQLLRDVTIEVPTNDDAVEINNTNGKNITIDGCGYTLDVISTKHAIRIHQTSGTVAIKNCNVVHSGAQMLVRIGDGSYTEGDTENNVTFQLRDVNIASTGTYQYCLIATQDQGNFNLDMTNVTVDWVETTNTNEQRAFVRCGGSGYTQTVNLNMTGSTIDVSEAALTQGGYIYRTADVTVTSDENTGIPTAEGISGYKKEVLGTQAEYLDALDFANASKEDVTLKFIGDITYQFTKAGTNDAIINNVYGKNVTIDGDGLTLETSSKYSAYPDLRIEQTNGEVTIKNLNIIHSGSAMWLRIGDNEGNTLTDDELTVNLTNVTITSTGTYKYCLIGTQNPQIFRVNMKNVTVDWNGKATTDNEDRAFVRCGGNHSGQTLYLTMDECEVDVVDAAPTQGLYIHTTVTGGELKLENTTITTADGVATYTNKGGMTVPDDL